MGRSANAYRRLVTFSACFFLFAAIALLMPIPLRGRVWDQVADLLHIPAFALVNFLALSITRYHSSSRWIMPAVVTFGVISVSGVIEILQGLLGRHASLGDLATNALGASASLAVFLSLRATRSRPLVGMLRVAAVLLILLAACRPVLQLADIYHQRTRFPAIASFESWAELGRWYFSSAHTRRLKSPLIPGDHALRVTFFPDDFPAIQLQRLQPDWSDYQTFETDVAHHPKSSSELLRLQLRITDRYNNWKHEDSFSTIIELRRGASVHLRIDLEEVRKAPATRQLRMDAIRNVEFMAIDLSAPATVDFGPIRLR